MTEERTLAGRSLAAFRRDPNFSGAFVGGPPLLSAEQVSYIVANRDAINREAAATLRQIRERLAEKKAREGAEAEVEAEKRRKRPGARKRSRKGPS